MVNGVWLGCVGKTMKVDANMTYGELIEQFMVENGCGKNFIDDVRVARVNGVQTLYQNEALLLDSIRRIDFWSKQWEDIAEARKMIRRCFSKDDEFPDVKAKVLHFQEYMTTFMPEGPQPPAEETSTNSSRCTQLLLLYSIIQKDNNFEKRYFI